MLHHYVIIEGYLVLPNAQIMSIGGFYAKGGKCGMNNMYHTWYIGKVWPGCRINCDYSSSKPDRGVCIHTRTYLQYWGVLH